MKNKDRQSAISFATQGWDKHQKKRMFIDLKERIDKCNSSIEIISIITCWNGTKTILQQQKC